MNTKQSISDGVFRFKLLIGSIFFGAFTGTIFFLFWLAEWRDMDLIQLFKVFLIAYELQPTQLFAAAGLGGFTFLWLVALFLFKPWQSGPAQPEDAGRGSADIKKPW